MAEATTIRVYVSTKQRLDTFIEKKSDSYDDILNRLMDLCKKEEPKK